MNEFGEYRRLRKNEGRKLFLFKPDLKLWTRKQRNLEARGEDFRVQMHLQIPFNILCSEAGFVV